MYIYYTAGLHQKVLAFFVHYLNKNFPFIKLKLFPIHIVRTCLSENCVIHSEHRLDDAIKNVLLEDDKSLLAIKEPWLEGQGNCDLLLDGNAIALLLHEVKDIDELVWKLIHSIGHLYGLKHCDKPSCAISNPIYVENNMPTKPICNDCEKMIKLANEQVLISSNSK